MARVRTGPHRRRKHKKILSQTKGFRMTRNRLVKVAKEALLHSGQYAFHGRKLRKRDLRTLWVQRINIALRSINPDYKYSRFIKQASDKNIVLNRKILADLAVSDSKSFETIAREVFK